MAEERSPTGNDRWGERKGHGAINRGVVREVLEYRGELSPERILGKDSEISETGRLTGETEKEGG